MSLFLILILSKRGERGPLKTDLKLLKGFSLKTGEIVRLAIGQTTLSDRTNYCRGKARTNAPLLSVPKVASTSLTLLIAAPSIDPSVVEAEKLIPVDQIEIECPARGHDRTHLELWAIA